MSLILLFFLTKGKKQFSNKQCVTKIVNINCNFTGKNVNVNGKCTNKNIKLVKVCLAILISYYKIRVWF